MCHVRFYRVIFQYITAYLGAFIMMLLLNSLYDCFVSKEHRNLKCAISAEKKCSESVGNEGVQVESTDSNDGSVGFGRRELFLSRYFRFAAQVDNADADVDVDNCDTCRASQTDDCILEDNDACAVAKQIRNEASSSVEIILDDDSCEECELHWLEKIGSRFTWSIAQQKLFAELYSAVSDYVLADLASQHNRRILDYNRLVSCATRFRYSLACVEWNDNVSWVHSMFMEHFPTTPYLAAYLQVLQVLRHIIPAQCCDAFDRYFVNDQPSALASFLTQVPADPARAYIEAICNSDLFKLKEESPTTPLFVLVPPLPSFSATEQHLASSRHCGRWSQVYKLIQDLFGSSAVELSLTIPDATCSVQQCMTRWSDLLSSSLTALRKQHQTRPFVLIGWEVSGLLICKHSIGASASDLKLLSAVVCLAFPNLAIDGLHGDVDDWLLSVTCSTLFVVGQHSMHADVDALEDMRSLMAAEFTGVVEVGGASAQLTVSERQLSMYSVTQRLVDACIVEQIVCFVNESNASRQKLEEKKVADEISREEDILKMIAATEQLPQPPTRNVEEKCVGQIAAPSQSNMEKLPVVPAPAVTLAAAGKDIVESPVRELKQGGGKVQPFLVKTPSSVCSSLAAGSSSQSQSGGESPARLQPTKMKDNIGSAVAVIPKPSLNLTANKSLLQKGMVPSRKENERSGKGAQTKQSAVAHAKASVEKDLELSEDSSVQDEDTSTTSDDDGSSSSDDSTTSSSSSSAPSFKASASKRTPREKPSSTSSSRRRKLVIDEDTSSDGGADENNGGASASSDEFDNEEDVLSEDNHLPSLSSTRTRQIKRPKQMNI